MAGRGRRKSHRARSAAGSGGFGRGLAIAALLLFIAVVVVGAAYVFLFKVDRTAYDSDTLCPEDGPVAHLALLLDTTDPVSRAQVAAAKAFIADEIEEAEPGTMISVAEVSGDADTRGNPEFMLCKPRMGTDANRFYENPAMIRRRYEERFEAPLEAALDALLTAEPADSSPIMESLQAQVSLTPGFRTFEGPRKLVVFSDLLQHSDVLSVYRGQDWGDLAASGSAERLARSLQDVEVLLLKVPRPRTPRAEADDLWANYFDFQGAGRVRVRTIGDL